MSIFETFAADAAIILNEIGRTVHFRGNQVKGIVGDPNFGEQLIAGGFEPTGTMISLKLLRQPLESSIPQTGELVGYPLDGNGSPTSLWQITSIETRPLSAWVKLDLKPWNA